MFVKVSVPSVQNQAKQNKSILLVGMAEWIIDDKYFFCEQSQIQSSK